MITDVRATQKGSVAISSVTMSMMMAVIVWISVTRVTWSVRVIPKTWTACVIQPFVRAAIHFEAFKKIWNQKSKNNNNDAKWRTVEMCDLLIFCGEALLRYNDFDTELELTPQPGGKSSWYLDLAINLLITVLLIQFWLSFNCWVLLWCWSCVHLIWISAHTVQQ